jgi:hypothetical protein
MCVDILIKTCAKCKVEKPTSAFSKESSSRDGLQYLCKECQAKANKVCGENNKGRESVIIPALKLCFGCGLEKPSSEFFRNKRSLTGLDCYCKECSAKRKKEQKEKYKARVDILVPDFKTCPGCKIRRTGLEFNRNFGNKDGLNDYCKMCASIRNRRRLYGVSPEWINATTKAQGGACAICKWIPGPQDRDLYLDHDHVTGKPRGFLCFSCNNALGYFNDNYLTIEHAVKYLDLPLLKIYYKKWVPRVLKQKLLIAQDFMCKICFKDLRVNRACLDHCHKTLMIRGYLCQGCNCGIGQFKEVKSNFEGAIVYLRAYLK